MWIHKKKFEDKKCIQKKATRAWIKEKKQNEKNWAEQNWEKTTEVTTGCGS